MEVYLSTVEAICCLPFGSMFGSLHSLLFIPKHTFDLLTTIQKLMISFVPILGSDIYDREMHQIRETRASIQALMNDHFSDASSSSDSDDMMW